MAFGTALFLLAAGAVLRWAITTTVSGVDLKVIGVILMVIGAIGFLVALFWMLTTAQRMKETGRGDGQASDTYHPPRARV